MRNIKNIVTVISLITLLLTPLLCYAEGGENVLRKKGNISLDWQVLGFGSPVGFTGLLATMNLENDRQIELGVGNGIFCKNNYAVNYRYLRSPETSISSVFYGGAAYSANCEIEGDEGFFMADGPPGPPSNTNINRDAYWLDIGWGFNASTKRHFHFEIGVGLTVGVVEGMNSPLAFPFLNLTRIGWEF